MKKLIWILIFTAIIGCKKEITAPISAEQEFKNLPESYRPPVLPDSLNKKINFFQDFYGTEIHNLYLFYKSKTGDIPLENVSKVSFVRGFGDYCCVAYYGGPYLPSGNALRIFYKTDIQTLALPSDTLSFFEVRNNKADFCIQFISNLSYFQSMGYRDGVIRTGMWRYYYGRYNLNNKILTMDKK